MSDSEESWHSFLEPETLEDVFKKRILEYNPNLGLNISKNIRNRSLELIDTLVLPLNTVNIDEIQVISLPMLRVIHRIVVVYSDSVHQLAALIEKIQTFGNLILSEISELEIIKDEILSLENENDKNDEQIIKDVVKNFTTSIERLRLKNIDLSIFEFLKLFQLNEFSKLKRIDLEDCEFEGIKRTKVFENKFKISINSLKEFYCIRTNPILAMFCPNLKKVVYEAKFPMEDYVYNSFQKYNNSEKGIGIEFFELRVPRSEISEVQFLENFFIGSFPDLENLKEFRIVGYTENNKESKVKTKYGIIKQLKEMKVGYIKKNSFPMLKVLELRNLYISLDTFDHIILMFSLINNAKYTIQDDNNFINNYQKVSAAYDLRFENGSSRNHNYNINKYQSMSIQEESDFMLSSDYNNLGFSHPNDINGENKNECKFLGMRGFKDKDICKLDGFNTYNIYNDKYHNNSKETSKVNEKSFMNYKMQNQILSQHEPQTMHPFLDIKSWIVRVSKSKEDNVNIINYSLNSGVLVLDNQLEEMKYQSITEIHRNLVSRTILKYLVDPLKTCVSISNSKIILSLGFDNLIYSGYILGIISEYQKTIKELSALSFLIPIDFFCQLEFNQIQILRVSLFKDKNLEPKDLIKLCTWMEKYGRNMNYIHIRVTGTSSKWVPKETEIKRLVNIWKKLCPKVKKTKDQDQIKFECCFTDNIFSKMNNLSNDFEFDTESD